MVMKEMQATVPHDDMFNNDTTQMFTEMLNDEFGKLAASGHGFGLADSIVRSFRGNHPSHPVPKPSSFQPQPDTSPIGGSYLT